MTAYDAISDRNVLTGMFRSAFKCQRIIICITITISNNYILATIDIDHVIVLIGMVIYLNTGNGQVFAGQVMLHPHGRVPHINIFHLNIGTCDHTDDMRAVQVPVRFLFCAYNKGLSLSVNSALSRNADVAEILTEDQAFKDNFIIVTTYAGFYFRIILRICTPK